MTPKKLWDHLEEYLLVPLLAFSAIVIFIQVIMRYVFHNSLSWSEELVRFLYIWEIWLGVSYATKRCSQLRISIIVDHLPEKVHWVIETVVMILWFAFGVFLIVVGFDMCMRVAELGQRSTALRIPMQYVYSGIPIGAALMNIRLIENFVQHIGKLFSKKRGEAS